MKLTQFIEELNKFHGVQILQFSKHENRSDWHDADPKQLLGQAAKAGQEFSKCLITTPTTGQYHEYIIELRKHAANLANWCFILQDKKCCELLNESLEPEQK